MTPGLAGPPFPERAKKGALAAIASIENPSVPLVIGTCAIDVASLKTTQGAKGHAVETFHWAGDDLWDWSTSGKSGIAAPSALSGWLLRPEKQLEEMAKDISIDDEDEDGVGGVSLQNTPAKSLTEKSQRNVLVDGEDAIAERVDDTARDTGPGMSPQEIDDAFLRAFLYGVYHQKQTVKGDPKFGLKFPLTQSFVMSNLVHPFLPIFTPEQSASLQIKKTSWKNVRKFIIALGNRKIVLAKDSRNEAMIWDIDFDDQRVNDFTPYQLPKKDDINATSSEQPSKSASNNADDAIGQQLKVQNLYKPRDSLSDIFKGAKTSKGPYYSATDVRTAVTDYVETNQMISPSNKRLVILDPVISNAVLSTGSAADKEVLAKGSIPRDALVDRVTSLCSTFHLILRNGETLESSTAKPTPGLATKVGIIMETRGGNKTATRVHGFENYFISSQPLADELRKACAGSTSVEPFKGGKGMEVMVQGPQKDAVIKALEKRGVNKQSIEVTDKTKGKKK